MNDMTRDPGAALRDLRVAAAIELIELWTDFARQVDDAKVTTLDPTDDRLGWSMGMVRVAVRIARLSALLGSPSWRDIEVSLLLDGWWEAVHKRMGAEPPPFDRHEAQVLRNDVYGGAHGTVRRGPTRRT